MVKVKTKSKKSRVLILIGSLLLVIMAIFHGSGFFYVSKAINESNSEEFLKEIVPVLFAHPSIHLIGLSSFGFLTLFLQHDAKKLLLLLSLIVLMDGILAFYLGGMLPGALLSVSAICFFITRFKIIGK